jgi:hypothetical protein
MRTLLVLVALPVVCAWSVSQPARCLHSSAPARCGIPVANFFGGLAKALEGALSAAWPGRLELLTLSEAVLVESAEVRALLGEEVTIGDVDMFNSMSTESGDLQLQCAVTGSKGANGILNIRGGAGDGGAMEIELLHLRVGDAFVDATPD